MSQFSEYTKFRDIVVKRLKRRGVDAHVPTVKEIKNAANPESLLNQNLAALKQYIAITDLKREESRKPAMSEAERKAKRREYSRDYRRRKVAQEHERPEYPKKYQSYLKGIKKLGVDIPPSKLPAFFAYMDYRFAQGNSAKKYVFDIFVDDYQRMLQKGYRPNQILGDFQKFEADQAALSSRADNMEGITAEKAVALWDKFITQ